MPELIIDERIHDTANITGTGDYILQGAPTGKQSAAVLGATNYSPMFITDDTNWEAGLYTYQSGPGRLVRTHVVKSSGGGTPINWNNANVKIKCGWPAWLAAPRAVTKSVAGGVNVTLTALEQTCDVLELTGVISANIAVIVDVTKWPRLVKNSTTGDFTLTLKTAAGSGVKLPRGVTVPTWCDGANVVAADGVLRDKTTVASATTPDIWTGTGPLIDYTGTTAATGFAAAPNAGARRTLLCAATCSFTHGANLLVPGSANYTAAAGDLVTVIAVTTTQFRLEITRANGQPAVAGADASDTVKGIIEIAVQSEMEAASSNVLAVTPGRQHFHPSAAKGWVNFNGTGTVAIRVSYNVSSITDNGVGDYTINWTVAFSSADYAAVGSVQSNASNAHLIAAIKLGTAPTASALRVTAGAVDDGVRDPLIFNAVAFGDQ